MNKPTAKHKSRKAAVGVATREKSRKSVVDHVADQWGQNPTLLRLHENCHGDDDPFLTYPTRVSARTQKEMKEEITRRVLEYHDAGGFKEMGVICLACGGIDSPASNVQLDLVRANKSIPKIRKAAGHSLTQLVTAAAPSNAVDNPYDITGVTVTLVMLAEGEASPLASLRPNATNYGSPAARPDIPPEWCSNPTREEIEKLVSKFMDAPKVVRQAMHQLARTEAGSDAIKRQRWLESRASQVVALFQIDTLTPLAKTFVGVGRGEVILRQASAMSQVRATKAKKTEHRLDRADVIHLFWRHALATNGNPPPLVKM